MTAWAGFAVVSTLGLTVDGAVLVLIGFAGAGVRV